MKPVLLARNVRRITEAGGAGLRPEATEHAAEVARRAGEIEADMLGAGL